MSSRRQLKQTHKTRHNTQMSQSQFLKIDFRKLKREGYMVIPNVLSPTECKQFAARLYETANQLIRAPDLREGVAESPEVRNAARERNFFHCRTARNWPGRTRGKIFQNYGAGTSPVAMDLRSHRKVLNVWSQYYGVPVDELVSSCDAISFARHDMRHGKPDIADWLHIDESYSNKLNRVQGFVTFEDQGAYDATLIVIPESNHFKNEFFERNPELKTQKHDFVKIRADHFVTPDGRTLKWIKVVAPAGSMVLWESKTMHCAGFYEEEVPEGVTQHNRAVIYTCCAPRVPGVDIVFQPGRTSTHEPIYRKYFPDHPRFGKKIEPLFANVVSPNKRLFGRMPDDPVAEGDKRVLKPGSVIQIVQEPPIESRKRSRSPDNCIDLTLDD